MNSEETRKMGYKKKNILALKCMVCGKEYDPDEIDYVCPEHGLRGNLDVIYDYDWIRESLTKQGLEKNPDPSMWRYLDLLPILESRFIPPLRIGGTPLLRAKRLEDKLGLNELWIKDDGQNPTGSYKDRASAIGVIKALEKNKKAICCASSGNAASSLAGVSASAGLESYLFVPETAPEAKIVQMLVFGAHVMLVKGTYDQAYDLSLEAVKKYDWYCRNSGYNPYLSEGKKTGIIEICEQLNWDPPDNIIVAVGDGCIIGGVWKGIKDLMSLGFIEKAPKIFGVQAEGASPLVNAWKSNTEKVSALTKLDTIADSISVGDPKDAVKALRAVYETRGEYVSVSDSEISEAMRVLARGVGVFGEPAAAAAFAGLLKLKRQDKIGQDDRSVVMITGNGLKDITGAKNGLEKPQVILPDLSSLNTFFSSINE